MSIKYNSDNKTFHLKTKCSSYIIKIMNSGQLAHLYWGKRIKTLKRPERLIPGQLRAFQLYLRNNPAFSLDYIPQEYPAFGTTYFRNPVY